MMRLAVSAFLLACSIQAAFAGLSHSTSGTSFGPTPQIIQHVPLIAIPDNAGAPNGNAYQSFIAPTGSGDTIIYAITLPHGLTPTVTDSSSDASPTAICSADDGSGNHISYIYAFVPTAGTTWIETTLSAASTPFAATVTELNNIASATDQGHNCQAGLTTNAGLIQPTAFTPTTNDSTGGNYIYNYTALAASPTCNAQYPIPASGFVTLDGDAMGSFWVDNDGFGFPEASQASIQRTAQATVASMGMPGEDCSGAAGGTGGAPLNQGDQFNTLTISLKIGAAGISNPTGIHVVKAMQISSFANNSSIVPPAYIIPTPTVGNLRVFAFESALADSYATATTVTSSDGCNYIKEASIALGNNATFWVAQNCNPCPNCYAIFHTSFGAGSFNNTGGQFYDIQNAQPSSFQNYTDGSPTCTSNGAETAFSFTPGSSTGITIMSNALGTGPASGITSGFPTDGVYTCPVFTGQGDGDYGCFGDSHGYLNYSTSAAQAWKWILANTLNTTCADGGAAFQ